MFTIIENYVKKLLKLERHIMMVDYENRVAFFTTKDYPRLGRLFFFEKDNHYHCIMVESITMSGKVYNLQTTKGLYLLRYVC